MSRTYRILTGAACALGLLASCGPDGFDPDLRRLAPGGLDTAQAAARAQPRPRPDTRGIISYPDYQIVVARAGETPETIAARLGLNGDELARYNAMPADTRLLDGSILVLPRRVQGGAPAGRVNSTGQVVDPFAGQGVSRPELPGGKPATAGQASSAVAAQPRQHQVVSGETAWSIARKYEVSVDDLAAWNGLPADMAVRVGQRLLIPIPGQKAPDPTAVTTAPGTGSPTPPPPSAAAPLPDEKTVAAAEPAPRAVAPDLGATRTQASGARFAMPVDGAIIRIYEKGKNDGIDIAAASGATVKAAESGSVAAITKDTNGIPIVVIRHDGDLMTVYTGMKSLSIAKGDRVTRGQTIGTAGDAGFVHFEIRRGFESVDPEDFLG